MKRRMRRAADEVDSLTSPIVAAELVVNRARPVAPINPVPQHMLTRLPLDWIRAKAVSSPLVHSNIYFIKAGEFVKIGFAKNVQKRIDLFQTGNPHQLELIKSLPSTNHKFEEKALHVLLDRHRLRGEWFMLSHGMIETIRKAKEFADLVIGLA